MPLGSDDEYTDLGTVNSLDPRFRASASFKRNPYREREERPAQGPLPTDGYERSRGGEPRRERTSSQRGVSPSASQQSRHTQSTVRPRPSKSHHSNGSIQSYSVARQGSFPVDATRPARRQESSVYSQDPVQPRETMSAYSGSRQAQPVYGNNTRPDDPSGLPMNMGALALDDRSRYSAAPSSNHNRERGLVSQDDFQDRRPLVDSTQQSTRSTRHDGARRDFERRRDIENAFEPLLTASDRYIKPRRAIEARGAQVLAKAKLTEEIMGPAAYENAMYGHPDIDFSQGSGSQPGVRSIPGSSRPGQPRRLQEPGFIEAECARVGKVSETRSHHSRHDSRTYAGEPLPHRAILPRAPPRRRSPAESQTASHRSDTTGSHYSKRSSGTHGSQRSRRRYAEDDYDDD